MANPMEWREAFDSLCGLRCKRAGLGDTRCMEICGEAGVHIGPDEEHAPTAQAQPTCGEILEALGFERPEDDDEDEDG